MRTKVISAAGLVLVVLFTHACQSTDCLWPGREPELRIDPLDQAPLACPFENTGAVPASYCPPDLEDGPSRFPSGGQLREANRLPEFLFEDMLSTEDDFGIICQDIFEDPLLLESLSESTVEARLEGQGGETPAGLARETQARGNLSRAIRSISDWGYCHKINQSGRLQIHASFLPPDRSIVLYATACDASDVYGYDLSPFTLSQRFTLVSAHEVGHAIQAELGTLPESPTAEAELRATWYGTYFTECHTRIWLKILADNAADDTPAERRARRCLAKKWNRLNFEVTELRKTIGAKLEERPVSYEVASLSRAFSCATWLPAQ